jgi:hypothetical protein
MPLIGGRVVDPDGHPIAGARVYLTRGPAAYPDVALVTSDDGTYTLAAPTEGEYEITASSDEHGTARATVEVRGEGVRGVELRVGTERRRPAG